MQKGKKQHFYTTKPHNQKFVPSTSYMSIQPKKIAKEAACHKDLLSLCLSNATLYLLSCIRDCMHTRIIVLKMQKELCWRSLAKNSGIYGSQTSRPPKNRTLTLRAALDGSLLLHSAYYPQYGATPHNPCKCLHFQIPLLHLHDFNPPPLPLGLSLISSTWHSMGLINFSPP